MERYAWKAYVNEGMLDEYVRRHAAVWPKMRDALKEAGIVNYSIWNTGNELFGYYECEKGADHAAEVQAKSIVVAMWNDYMKDVMTMNMDPATGAQPKMNEVFYLP
ncbi:MAG: L-rhamnose mutarotase [Candidatus Accumulibacter sp.]|jgi:L-rhamnose mutarotase|nr:L-rhamnose mutarotase [Accumulibacter sp.]